MSDNCNCESSNKELRVLRETLLNLRRRFQAQTDINGFVVKQFAIINDELEDMKQQIKLLTEDKESKKSKKKKK